ncbi:prephenate dehydratase [Candidatus Omnitrophota bacterium]
MSLDDLRKKIDDFDNKIIQLLNERTKLVLDIGKIKEAEGKEIYSPEREYQIYNKIDQTSKGPLPSDSLKIIYREIMSAALSLEKDLKIAYLGPEATFTHLAALSKFGSSVKYVGFPSISDVFIAVDKKHADYGVVPIENSTEGAVNHTLDMFMDSEIKICSEIMSEICHNLMSNSQLKDVTKIYSKSEVFGQCRIWLETNLPRVALVETASTTQAAKKAAQEEGAAAIASRLASSIYGLHLLEESIEDSAQNMTRFLVIGRKMPPPTGNDKTSIVLSIKDKIGALYDLLQPIKKNGINMTKIESRPSKKKAWDYFFFIDLAGHIEDELVKKTVTEMEDSVKFLKVLGSYPISKGEL